MKAKVRHLFEVIVGAILSLFGFSSCEDIINPVCEYGMPHATFKVTGTVKAEDTGDPIENIKVKFRHHVDGMEDENGNIFYEEIELRSDKDGKVDGSTIQWPYYQDIELTFEDTDKGENGGWFAPDTLKKSDLKIELEEDKNSSWNKGTYTISFEEKLKRDYTQPVD